MFKPFLLSLLLVAILLAPRAYSLAGPYDYGLGATAQRTGHTSEAQIPAIISKVVTAAFSMLLIIFLALAIYAGIQWMTAAGNEDRVNKARGTLIMAVIGLIIIISAYAITNFVLTRLPSGVGNQPRTTLVGCCMEIIRGAPDRVVGCQAKTEAQCGGGENREWTTTACGSIRDCYDAVRNSVPPNICNPACAPPESCIAGTCL